MRTIKKPLTMSNSIFHNLAIKCDTWNQMLQLKEMAEKEGLKNALFYEHYFLKGECYFIMLQDALYSCTSKKVTEQIGLTELSFTQFIQSLNQK